MCQATGFEPPIYKKKKNKKKKKHKIVHLKTVVVKVVLFLIFEY